MQRSVEIAEASAVLEAQIVEVTHKGDAQEVEAKIAEATHKGDAQEVEVPSSAMLQAQTADTVVEAVLEAQPAHAVLDTVPKAQIAEADNEVLRLSHALLIQEPSCSRVLARTATVILRRHKTPKDGTYNIMESRSGGVIVGHCTVSGHEIISTVEHFNALQHLHGFEKVTHVLPGFKWNKWGANTARSKLYAVHVVDVVKYKHPFLYVCQPSRSNCTVSLTQSVVPAELPQKRDLFHTALYYLSRLSEADKIQLADLASFLDQKVVPIMTVCSGLDGPADAARTLLSAIAHMQNKTIGFRHILAVECDENKIKYLLRAFTGEHAPEMLLDNVDAFLAGYGFDRVTDTQKNLPDIKPALGIVGFECDDLSSENVKKEQLASCLETDGSGVSNHTFRVGLLKAMDMMDPGVYIWENTVPITWSRTKEDGTKAKPQVEVVEKELQARGRTVEHRSFDSRRFLVPQRRNRVYGSADLGGDEDYPAKVAATSAALENSIQMPMSTPLSFKR